MQVVAAGANPVLITRGIEKTTKALVAELKKMSKEVCLSKSDSFSHCSFHLCLKGLVVIFWIAGRR